jgi:hypothetical protein
MKRSFKSKCACCIGGIGILLCTLFMSLSIVGIAAVDIAQSNNKNIEGMTSMSSSQSHSSMKIIPTSNGSNVPKNNSSPLAYQTMIINFFSGFLGEVILLLSFGIMFVGMWFTGNRKLIPISVAGAVILYISMYAYYSLTLEIIGSVILALAYISAYNYKFARIAKLT